MHLPGASPGAGVADVLYEDDVVDAVCRFLERNDYVVRQSLTSVQRGHDIIADKHGDPTWTLYVEAKGEGSSKTTTARYGSSFNSGQVFDHVAKAVLKALRVASWDTTEPASRAGIALPENAAHVLRSAANRGSGLRMGLKPQVDGLRPGENPESA